MESNIEKTEKPKINVQFSTLLKDVENIAICTAADADSLNAGVALVLYIEEKYNKKPYLIYSGDLEKVNHTYADLAEIRQSFKGRTLKMTLDYQNTNIESLTWEKTDDSKLVLEVGPINRAFDLEKISYDFEGKDVELIITVGIPKLEFLNGFYKMNKAEFEKAQIVNIDIKKDNKRYGAINFVYPESESVISLLLRKFGEWKYTPSTRVTSVLLYGLQQTAPSLSEDEDLEVVSNFQADS